MLIRVVVRRRDLMEDILSDNAKLDSVHEWLVGLYLTRGQVMFTVSLVSVW